MQMSWRRNNQLERYCIRLNWLPFLKPLITDKGETKPRIVRSLRSSSASSQRCSSGEQKADRNRRFYILCRWPFSANNLFLFGRNARRFNQRGDRHLFNDRATTAAFLFGYVRRYWASRCQDSIGVSKWDVWTKISWMNFATMGTREIYFAQVPENFRFTSGKHVHAVDVSFWKVREGRRWRIKREIGRNIREVFVPLFKSLQTSAREFSRQGKQSSPILSSRYKFLRGNKARWPFLARKPFLAEISSLFSQSNQPCE